MSNAAPEVPNQLITDLPVEEQEVLKALRDLQFGVVEVVVHDRRITEIRQTRKTRLGTGKSSTV